MAVRSTSSDASDLKADYPVIEMLRWATRRGGSVDKLLAVLDDLGLSGRSPEDLMNFIYALSKKRLSKCADKLIEVTHNLERRAKPDKLDIFNFLAGSAIRGDSGCLETGCQSAKLHRLSRFAALYADRVIFPVDFAYFDFDKFDRYRFFHSVRAVSYLRPLIEAGIVQLTLASTCICRDCLVKGGVDLKRVESETKAFWRERVREFEVVYRPPNGRKGPKLLVIGPDMFLPHGRLEVELRDPLKTSFGRAKTSDDGFGFVVPSGTIVREDVLGGLLFSDFKTDLMAQQLYGIQFGTTYLTDSCGQAEFFRELRARGESMANAARLCTHLAHSVPLFSELSVEKALQIRVQEPEAFIRYRSALNDIVREHIRPGVFLGPKEAEQIYHDILRPRIAKLKSEALLRTRTSKRKAFSKIACSFAAITLGVVNGLLPTELAKLFMAVGGVSLLKDIGEAIADIQRRPNEVRNNDLYFLLELEQRIQR